MNSADIIITMRTRAGLSKRIGVVNATVWLWETGQTCPSVDRLVLIARATGFEIVIKEKFKND